MHSHYRFLEPSAEIVKGAKEQTLANFVSVFGGAQLKVKFGEFSEAVLVFAVSTLQQLSTFGEAQLKVKCE